MKLEDITDKDIGRTVIMTPFRFGKKRGSDQEFGIISSFNEKYVFVKYKTDAKHGIATYPEDLEFMI